MHSDYDVSVIGLGSMGSAIATCLLDNGYRVAVWNRSPKRAESLAEHGASRFDAASEAIASAPVTIMCVSDCDAAAQILSDGSVRASLAGRVFVQATSSSIEDANEQADLVRALGGKFLVGGIMANATRVGSANCMVMFSGDEVFSKHRELLMALGGASRFLGEAPAAAIAAYTSVGAYYSDSLLLFLETGSYAFRSGMKWRDYVGLIRQTMPEILAELEACSERVDSNHFEDTSASIDTYLAHMIENLAAFRNAGIDARMTQGAIDKLAAATASGFGTLDIARIADPTNG